MFQTFRSDLRKFIPGIFPFVREMSDKCQPLVGECSGKVVRPALLLPEK